MEQEKGIQGKGVHVSKDKEEGDRIMVMWGQRWRTTGPLRHLAK